MQLRKYRIRLNRINHIFISHIHGDHIFGLFGLISTFSLLGRKSSLHIYGPHSLEDILLDHLKYFRNDLSYHLIIHKIQCRKPAKIFEDEIVEVKSLPLIHRVPTCGYLFREKSRDRNVRKEMITKHRLSISEIAKVKKGEDLLRKDGTIIPNLELAYPPYRRRSYAYCSDTSYNEELVQYLSGTDLLYHEATFSEKDLGLAAESFHSTSSQAARLAKKSEVGKLLIGHFSSRYKDLNILEEEACKIFRNTVAVKDGDVFSVRQVRETDNDYL